MTLLNGVEIVTFEDVMLGFDEPLKCENTHKYSVCSIEVVYRVTDCMHSTLQCKNAGERNIERMDRLAGCAACRRLAMECWKVVPL